MKIEIAQIITQIISFLLMLWILGRFAWKPIMSTLDDRTNRIASDFQKIEDEQKKVSGMMQEYQDKLAGIEKSTQEAFHKAIEEAKVQSQKIQDEAHQEARMLLVKAQEDIQKEIAQAHTRLKKDLVGMVYSATEKVL